MHLSRQTRVRLVAATVVLFASACRSDGGVGPDTNLLDASYALVSADARPLPITVFTAFTSREDVVGARLVLDRNRSARLVFQRRVTNGSVAGPITFDSTTATYAITGTRLILTYPAGGRAIAPADTGTIDDSLGPAALITIEMDINGRAGNVNTLLQFIRDDAGTRR